MKNNMTNSDLVRILDTLIEDFTDYSTDYTKTACIHYKDVFVELKYRIMNANDVEPKKSEDDYISKTKLINHLKHRIDDELMVQKTLYRDDNANLVDKAKTNSTLTTLREVIAYIKGEEQ